MRPHRWQPTRLSHPWDSPGKNTGVGCHFLLQCMKVKSESEVAQSCLTLSDPMDCSLLGSSIHGILLEYWSGVPLPSLDYAKFVFPVAYSHGLVCIQLIMKDFFKCLEALWLLPFVTGLCVPWCTASVFRQIWTLTWFSFKRTQSWPEVFPNHRSFFSMPTVLQKYMACACTWCSGVPGIQWNFPKSPMDFSFNRYL